MAQIQFTPYVSQNITTFNPIEEEEIIIPKIKSRSKPKEEISLAPLPKLSALPEVRAIDTSLINWNDSSREGKGRSARNYLMSKLGLSDYQASALVGSFMRESGLNINAENKAEKAGKNSSVKPSQYGIGIGQWTHNRHDDFVRWISTHGNSLQSQLDFAVDEIEKKYPEYLSALKQSTSPDEASDLTYVMYTGGNYKNVSGDQLAKAVAERDRAYGAKHTEMYGKDSNNHSARRRKATMEALTYRLGGILKMQKAGRLSTNETSIQMAPKEPPKGYVRQFDLSDAPRTKDDGFDKWYKYVSSTLGLDPDPNNQEHYYDYRGFYDEVVVPSGNQYAIIPQDYHFPDTYKRPGHPTFSIESKYYKPGMDAGHWNGDVYIDTPMSDEEMEARQHWAETRFKNGRSSEVGARGAYQFMPATWTWLNQKYKTNLNIDNYNDNKKMRDLYMKELMNSESIKDAKGIYKNALAYAAYNWGIGNINNFIRKQKDKGVDVYSTLDWINDLPKETRNYVNFIVRGIDGQGDLTSAAFNKALPNRFKAFPEVKI